MKRSRLRRVEEKRLKKRIVKLTIATFAIFFLLVLVGPRLLVRLSIFFGDTKSNVLTQQKDTTPPFPPVIESLPEATGKQTITIKGYGEAEATLELFINKQKIKETLIDTKGNFNFNTIKLKKGRNDIYAISFDTADNTSNPSNIHTIFYLPDGPRIEVIEPEDGKSVSDELIAIKGITDKSVRITINERFVSVEEDGSFKFETKLQEGENTITIKATDKAQNTTEIIRTVTYSP